jgi:hypothetical protein
MKKNSFIFELFLYAILAVKLSFLLSMLLGIKAKIDGNKEEYDKYTDIKERLHKLFTICMGILLMILFSPLNTPSEVCVYGDTKLFLYIFGILSIGGILQEFAHQIYTK